MNNRIAFIIGLSLFAGLSVLGLFILKSTVNFKEYERTVTVKGLSEREVSADIVIWPVQFTEASNSLEGVYSSLQITADKIRSFLISKGVTESEISFSTPQLTDKSAQAYGAENIQLRYVISQTVTIYSNNVEKIREIMTQMAELGKQGVALTGTYYQNMTDYQFTGLNELKPEMIEEATRNAREVAQKFADDSDSELGKIKTAYQGQFSISPRDQNNPHIKNVRVVSTIVYYLSD